MTSKEAINFLKTRPADFGRLVGFSELTSLHNDWIKKMFLCEDDFTLQAHRGSYKTTCVSITLALIIMLLPSKRTMFIRKTDEDTKEIIKQVQKILSTECSVYFSKCIYGVPMQIISSTQSEITTNLTYDTKGTPQLQGKGTVSSITGKHVDYIFTDDIVNVNDRISKSERERTKLFYQELQNIKNRGGRICNTGTPWHKEDCFTLMPNPEKWDCYSTGMMTEQDIADTKDKMTASLFAANYELKHIADDQVIFDNPHTGFDMSLAEQGVSHVDAAYGGEDWTAFTICRKTEGKYYVYGRCWRRHVDDVLDEIVNLHNSFNCGIIYCEDNGDKGYLAKAMRQKGLRAIPYSEGQNKFLKITSYLKAEWKKICFVVGTDKEYIEQICEYNENAEHDDCPDSLASLVRKLWQRAEGSSSGNNNTKRTMFI